MSIRALAEAANGTRPGATVPPAPVPLGSGKRAHRKLYSGGFFSDAIDFLGTGARASAATVGSLLHPEGGSYLERYRNPETNYGDLIHEVAPGSQKTWYGRGLAGAAGFVGDVVLDPSMYIPFAGLAGKIGKVGAEGSKLAKGAEYLAQGVHAAGDPLGAVAKVARKAPVLDRAATTGARYLTEGLERAEGKLANVARTGGKWALPAKAAAYVIPTAAKKEAKTAIRGIRNTERLATTVNARNVSETAGKVDAIAAAEAKRLTGKRAAGWLKGSPVGATREGQAVAGDFRQGVGTALDKGWDASDKAATAALKTAARERSARKAAAGRALRVGERAGAKGTAFGSEAKALEKAAKDSEARLAFQKSELAKLEGDTAADPAAIAEQRGRMSQAEADASYSRRQATRATGKAKKANTFGTAQRAQGQAEMAALKDPAAKAQVYADARAAGTAAADPAIEAHVQDLVAKGYDETAVRDALKIAQEQGNRQGAALAANEIITPETAARNTDVYARRIYQKHQRPDEYLQSLSNDPIAYLMEEARQAGTRGAGGGAGGNPVAKVAMRRKSLDEATRGQLGEISDVTPRLLQGGDIAGRAVARKQALDAIATHGVDEATAHANPEAYRLLEGTQWGPAEGSYLPREVYDEVMRGYPQGGIGTGPLGQAYKRALGAWKFGKVILSPAAQVRNMGSNAWRAYTELGIRPDQFFKDMAGGARDVIGDTPAWRGAFETAPVFGSGNFLRSEFNRALDTGATGPRTGLAHVIGSIKDAAGLGMSKAAGLYSGIEDAGKMGIFNRKYAEAVKGGASEAEARAIGADAARRALFDYGEAPPMAEFAAKTGAIPFARYSSLAIPAEARSFLKHPERYAKMANATREWAGMAPDQEKQAYEEQTMPTGYRENLLFRNPFSGPGGRSLYTDLTTVVPFGNAVGGRGSADSIISNVNPMEANPGLSFLSALSTGVNPQTQQPISDAPVGTATRFKDWLEYGLQQALPPLAPVVGFHAQQIGRGKRGDIDPRTGVPISPALMRLRGYLGITQRPLDAGSNIQSLGREMASRDRQWQDTLNAKARRGATPEEMQATMAAAQADMEAANAGYMQKVGPLEGQ